MQDYQHLNQEALIDLLARHTAGYTRAFIEGSSPEELDKLRDIVLSLQDELTFRKEIYDSHNDHPASANHRKPGESRD